MLRIFRLTLACTATLAVLALGTAVPASAVAVDCPSQTGAILTCSTTVAEGNDLAHSEIQITIVTLTPTFEFTLPVPGGRERRRVSAAIRRTTAMTATGRRTSR